MVSVIEIYVNKLILVIKICPENLWVISIVIHNAIFNKINKKYIGIFKIFMLTYNKKYADYINDNYIKWDDEKYI